MIEIKFGTDGWRAIIAKEYTVDNVARVADATARFLKKRYDNPSVVLGHDARFGGPMFAEIATKVICGHGIKVYLADRMATTPMISLGTIRLKAQQGVVITASHNPADYNGYKLKSELGGPSVPADIEAVEKLIRKSVPKIPDTTIEALQVEGLVEMVNLEKMYLQEVQKSFDLKKIQKKVKIGYDAMYGAGQDILPQILPGAKLLHCERNPSFMGQAPEPIERNLQEFSKMIKKDKKLIAGLANDGDADRIGLFDEKGRFVDSHHILLLLTEYLHKHKGMTGEVIHTFSVTGKVRDLCDLYGLKYQVTKIGFKYICQLMSEGTDVLVGGEESGGIAVKGFIPERDGIWIGLVLFEYMAVTGKPLSELIKGIYKKVGKFVNDRDDLHIANDKKWQIMDNCKAGKYDSFGSYKVQKIESLDGYKFHLSDKEWVMIRPSGTEPVLRVYAEAPSKKKVRQVLESVHGVLGKV